jgi:hypothetical protein
MAASKASFYIWEDASTTSVFADIFLPSVWPTWWGRAIKGLVAAALFAACFYCTLKKPEREWSLVNSVEGHWLLREGTR